MVKKARKIPAAKKKVFKKKSAKKKGAKKKGAAKKSTRKKSAMKKAAMKMALQAGTRYCYLITADPNWVERCEYGPDGRCNLNCIRIPASEVPGRARIRARAP